MHKQCCLAEDGYQLPRLPNHPSVADLISWGVDGFEVVHESTFDYAVYQAAAQHNLIQMVGTDVHHPSTPAQTWLAVQAPNMTRAGIMQAIRARQTSFLMDPAGTPQRAYPTTNAGYSTLLPLTALGAYFGMFYSDTKGMYSFQGTFCQPEQLVVNGNVIGWFIFWLLLLVLIFELLRLAVLCSASMMMAWRLRSPPRAT